MSLYKPRLLITDSDNKTLLILKKILAKHDYEIITESNALIIYNLLENECFDLILLDITISDIKPLNIIELILNEYTDTSIICVSDTDNYDTGIEAVKNGAYDVLIKPYDMESLPTLIEQAINELAEETRNMKESGLTEITSDIYKYMVDNSQDIQYLLDKDGRFLFINKRVESLLGYSQSELIGQHYSKLIRHDDLIGWKYRFHDSRRKVNPLRSTELQFNSRKNKARYFDVKSISINSAEFMTNSSLSAEENNVLESAATFGIAHDVTVRKKVERTAYSKASYDYLTGLPNKLLFYDRLNMAIKQANRHKKFFAVMFLDLDDFKYINDSYGHVVGDQILVETATRLRSCLRSGDTVARAGGDEFVFLLPQVNSKMEAAIIAKKITNKMGKDFVIEGALHSLSVSIGISLYPENGKSSELLIKSADQAMYQIKRNDKNGYKFLSSF
ncbi:MAG: diguanylate cyclase [Gammaproteobacteria bacterium]|nr:diguanylate cyclase [Gammaproteobacteria bacterium]